MNHIKAHFIYERELNESYMKAYIKTAKHYRNLNVLTELKTAWISSTLKVAEFTNGQFCFSNDFSKASQDGDLGKDSGITA